MSIRIVTPGGLRRPAARELCDYRLKLIKPLHPVEIVTVPAAKERKNQSILDYQHTELTSIERQLKSDDFVICLDERGKSYTTDVFTTALSQWQQESPQIVFVVGGTNGLHPQLRERADITLQLSALTLTQDLAMITLLESLYRSLTLMSSRKAFHR